MKKFVFWIVVVLCLAIFCIKVNKASAGEYYGTPMYYSKFTKDSYQCIYNKDSRMGYCGGARYPEEGVVGYRYGENIEAAKVKLLAEITCVAGVCKSQYGEPFGRTAVPGVSYWSVPVGFYLDTVNGKTRAYRKGTGALASTYPIMDVIDLPEYQDPPRGLTEKHKDTLVRYDVYCNPANECSYLGRTMMANELVRYIPKVMTHNCNGWFCYNPDRTIAGLNPKGY